MIGVINVVGFLTRLLAPAGKKLSLLFTIIGPNAWQRATGKVTKVKQHAGSERIGEGNHYDGLSQRRRIDGEQYTAGKEAATFFEEVSFEFATGNQSIPGSFQTTESRERVPAYQVGQKIGVYYDLNDPNHHQVADSQLERLGHTAFGFVMGLLFAAPLVIGEIFCFLTQRRNSMTRQEIDSLCSTNMTHKKPNLPTKVCVTCGREFAWRKKWAKVWEDVQYCSRACREKKSKSQTE